MYHFRSFCHFGKDPSTTLGMTNGRQIAAPTLYCEKYQLCRGSYQLPAVYYNLRDVEDAVPYVSSDKPAHSRRGTTSLAGQARLILLTQNTIPALHLLAVMEGF